MRLAYITNARIPSERANAIQTMQMCAALAAEAEVTLYCPRRRNPQFANLSPFEYYKVPHSFEIESVPCADWFHLSGGREWLERPIFLWQTFTFALALAKRLRAEPAAVYYSRDLLVLTLLMLLMPSQKPYMFFEMHSFPGSSLGRWLHRIVLNQIKGIVTITNGLRQQSIALNVAAERILVAPDGVDVSRYAGLTRTAARQELNLSATETLIVYTGHLYEWKGAAVMAEAVARLGNKAEGVLVGGTPADVERLRSQAQERGWHNLRILGYVPPDRVPLYQVAADVLVLPNSARSEISRTATSPLKLFEYMASGNPIVASDLPSLREILRDGENAMLVEPDSVVALAHGLQRVIADRDLGAKLAQQARLDVQGATWPARASRVILFIKEMNHR